jgi:trans-aconitate methyltransferase
MGENTWNAKLYDQKHGFVAEYGQSLLELLAIELEETILDLGCGTGHLTAKIAEKGARVRGIDSSVEMIATARQNYPHLRFEVASAIDFAVDEPLDAVFSNAVLHWILEADLVIDRVYRALKPKGRFVAEFGGKGNVGAIVSTVQAILQERGYALPFPWYFPSIGEYASRLEAKGFDVTHAILFDRPTPLGNGSVGLANWLQMFANGWLSPLSAAERHQVIGETEARLRSTRYQGEHWIVDYRRLQIIASKPPARFPTP